MSSTFVTDGSHSSPDPLRDRTSSGFLPPLESATVLRNVHNSEMSLVASVEALTNREVANNSPRQLSTALDAVPHELMLTLTRHHPGSRRKDANSPRSVGLAGKPGGAWHHQGRRNHVKHLVEQPISFHGHGSRDISFLYDAQHQVKHKAGALAASQTQSASAQKERSQGLSKKPHTLDSIMPEEYRIVKAPGVPGLILKDERHSTHLEDREGRSVAFPSLHPTSRQQVLALKETMAEMLAVAGVNEDGEPNGPTQLHNLLELTKREQVIYNVCFHELIRQVSVECAERGELLADIRKRYSHMISRIPQEIKSLHEELMAQRALDRRLAGELHSFERAIEQLSSELSDVRKRDLEITQQAVEAKENLSVALEETQKNANLLSEYHELYEMQRKRLEFQIEKLAQEKDVWQTAAHSLALKVTDEQSLQTARRLQLCEHCWYKLAAHFAVMLSDSDMKQLNKLQEHVHIWHQLLTEFCVQLDEEDEATREKLVHIRSMMRTWTSEFLSDIIAEDGSVEPPDQETAKRLWNDMRLWEEVITSLAERFSGNKLLDRETQLVKIQEQMTDWSDAATVIFTRHRAPDTEMSPEQQGMGTVNEMVAEFLGELNVRLSGENGVADHLVHLVNPLETWTSRVHVVATSSKMLSDSDWAKLSDNLADWSQQLSETIACIGSKTRAEQQPTTSQSVGSQRGRSADAHSPLHTDPSPFIKAVRQWLAATCNATEKEDGRIVQQVSDLHGDAITWMVEIILRLTNTEQVANNHTAANAKKDQPEESAKATPKTPASAAPRTPAIQTTSEHGGPSQLTNLSVVSELLSGQVQNFTSLLFRCCSDVIQMMIGDSKRTFQDVEEDDDYKDLQRMQAECDDWQKTSAMLLAEVAAVAEGKPPLSAVASAADIAAQGLPAPTKEETRQGEITDKDEAATAAASGSQQHLDEDAEASGQRGDDEYNVHVIGFDDNVHSRSLTKILPPNEFEQKTFTAGQEGNGGQLTDVERQVHEELKLKLAELELQCTAAEQRAVDAESRVQQLQTELELLKASTPSTRHKGSSQMMSRPQAQASSSRSNVATPAESVRSGSSMATRSGTLKGRSSSLAKHASKPAS